MRPPLVFTTIRVRPLVQMCDRWHIRTSGFSGAGYTPEGAEPLGIGDRDQTELQPGTEDTSIAAYRLLRMGGGGVPPVCGFPRSATGRPGFFYLESVVSRLWSAGAGSPRREPERGCGYSAPAHGTRQPCTVIRGAEGAMDLWSRAPRRPWARCRLRFQLRRASPKRAMRAKAGPRPYASHLYGDNETGRPIRFSTILPGVGPYRPGPHQNNLWNPCSSV